MLLGVGVFLLARYRFIPGAVVLSDLVGLDFMTTEELAFREFAISLFLIVLLKIVCFILGYLTVRLGYQLISSGAKGEFKFSARVSGAGADLVSVSPGLLFLLLGIFLIGVAMTVDKGVTQRLKINSDSEAPPQVQVPHKGDFPH